MGTKMKKIKRRSWSSLNLNRLIQIQRRRNLSKLHTTRNLKKTLKNPKDPKPSSSQNPNKNLSNPKIKKTPIQKKKKRKNPKRDLTMLKCLQDLQASH